MSTLLLTAHIRFGLCANQLNSRGVRRLSVRMWDKAIADGNVEQMFGMNIKQEGIEVQGDQVSPRALSAILMYQRTG